MARLASFTLEDPVPKAAKPWWKSKTVLVNLLIFIIAFIPPAQEFFRSSVPGGAAIADNLEQVTIWANLALRFFSHGPIGGTAGAAVYGIGVGTKKLGKGIVNLVPGVNLK